MNKTKELIYKIIDKHPNASVTVVMKLAYLIDLLSIKKNGNPISDLKYKRYFYGPFDSAIYNIIEEMIGTGEIEAEIRFTPDTQYAIYNSKKNIEVHNLSEEEQKFIDSSIEEFIGYGAKALTEIAYNTRPMARLGAKLGGSEHLNEALDMDSINEAK